MGSPNAPRRLEATVSRAQAKPNQAGVGIYEIVGEEAWRDFWRDATALAKWVQAVVVKHGGLTSSIWDGDPGPRRCQMQESCICGVLRCRCLLMQNQREWELRLVRRSSRQGNPTSQQHAPVMFCRGKLAHLLAGASSVERSKDFQLAADTATAQTAFRSRGPAACLCTVFAQASSGRNRTNQYLLPPCSSMHPIFHFIYTEDIVPYATGLERSFELLVGRSSSTTRSSRC